MTTNKHLSLADLTELCHTRLQNVFKNALQEIPSPVLKSAMTTALSNGGKQLRPLLIYTTGLTFDVALENLDVPAAAIEIMHTYSLIHDDLPCMDNADLRRGKPTSHKIYGEGMAVLTGDALQTLAIQTLANYPATLSAEQRLHMLMALSNAAGPYGMAAGQALDITEMHQPDLTEAALLAIYRYKTGALFTASVQLGLFASRDASETNLAALTTFGDCIGLAFQLQDDLLDIEASTEALGKPQGIDQKNQKVTMANIYGVEKTRKKNRIAI